MTKSIQALLVGAALTGFVAGASMVQAQDQPSQDAGKATKKAKVEKHCCKGQNSCKGQGGCGADKGKNDCKGQGGCSTKSKCAGQGACADEKK